MADDAPKKTPRGFAAMDAARRTELARKGGVAAHAAGAAHQFSREEARAAGKKGGAAPHATRGKTKTPAAPEPPERELREPSAPDTSPKPERG